MEKRIEKNFAEFFNLFLLFIFINNNKSFTFLYFTSFVRLAAIINTCKTQIDVIVTVQISDVLYKFPQLFVKFHSF